MVLTKICGHCFISWSLAELSAADKNEVIIVVAHMLLKLCYGRKLQISTKIK